jgi:hypothetical protein
VHAVTIVLPAKKKLLPSIFQTRSWDQCVKQHRIWTSPTKN